MTLLAETSSGTDSDGPLFFLKAKSPQGIAAVGAIKSKMGKLLWSTPLRFNPS